MLAYKCESVAYFFVRVPFFVQFCSNFFNVRASRIQKGSLLCLDVAGNQLQLKLRNMTKAEIERKKSVARSLYLAGMDQNEIADKLEVSRNTVSKWSTTESWKEQRAATQVTRPELVNKLLATIDTLITQVNSSNDPALIAGLADKLAKFSAVIEKLDKKANVVDAIEVFMAFNKWLQFNASYDPEITPELIKAINKYQNKFLMEKMAPGSPL